jgi:hypothetical protein
LETRRLTDSFRRVKIIFCRSGLFPELFRGAESGRTQNAPTLVQNPGKICLYGQPGMGAFSTGNLGRILPFMHGEEYRVGKMVEWL